jgi:hypothetical protein
MPPTKNLNSPKNYIINKARDTEKFLNNDKIIIVAQAKARKKKANFNQRK